MRNLFLFLFILAGFPLTVWAQQTPCFLAYNEQNQVVQTFCVGQRITFRDNSGQSNVTEFYDFDDRDGLDFSARATSHTFTAPGRFTVTQLKGVGNVCTRTFDVKAAAPASPPFLQKLTLEPTGIKIQLQTSAINDLIVERASSPAGTFTTVTTLTNVPSGPSEHLIALPSPSGCFRVRVTNVCTGDETILSNMVCAQSLQVSPGDRKNLLAWAANSSTNGVANYQLLRGGQPFQNMASSQTTFTDEQVACGRTYTYQLVALLANGSQSTSLPVQLETQGTTPPAAPLLVVSFNLQNQVVATTLVPAQETFKEQSLFRSLNGVVFGQILQKQPQNAVDATLPNLTSLPCYQVAFTDSCNLVSARSNTACPSVLTATLQPTGGVQLAWNAYDGFPGGVGNQTLELIDEQGNVYWSTPVSGQSFIDAQPQQQFQRLVYRLRTVSQNGAYESYSNTATVDQPFQFYFPTAFSPNNDGLNDVFRAVGAKFASSFTLQVLNRLGQVIFESKDPLQGWDGTYNGKPAPPATYLYRLEAVDVNGHRLTKSGTITLVR